MAIGFDRSFVLVFDEISDGIFGSVCDSFIFLTGAGIDTFGSGSLLGKSSLLGSSRESIGFEMIIGLLWNKNYTEVIGLLWKKVPNISPCLGLRQFSQSSVLDLYVTSVRHICSCSLEFSIVRVLQQAVSQQSLELSRPVFLARQSFQRFKNRTYWRLTQVPCIWSFIL